MTDLNEALSELISVHVGPGMGIPFEPLDFANETTGRAFATVIATILNAAASGQLIPLGTCNAVEAAMISRAREEGESIGSTAYLRAIDVVEAALVNNPRHDAARRIAVGALRLLADPRAVLRANATDASEGER